MCGARARRVRRPGRKSGVVIASRSNNSLDDLFVRYWENNLSGPEAAELEQRLSLDSQAREDFHFFCLQAVAAGELPSVCQPENDSVEMEARSIKLPARQWTRRQLFGYIGGGAAAMALASLLGRRQFGLRTDALSSVRVLSVSGEVTMRTAGGQNVRPKGSIPSGGTLATFGPVSSAVVACPGGSEISFTGDSEVAVKGDGSRLMLLQGTATAKVPPHDPGPQSLSLQTAHACLPRLSGVRMTMARTQRGTEVGVQNGMVVVDSPTGQSLGIVRAGEILTVRAGGDRSKQMTPLTPDDFSWDLSRPLPSGWNVGQREETPDGPVVVPDLWLDPYYQVEMCQIRSDKQWARGFFRLFPDSTIRIRYWVDRPGPSQVVICVRTASHSEATTGVVECNAAFEQAKPQSWQTLEVRAQDMLDNPHAPRFGAPWIGFLVIFNTYRSDIGLKVAGFAVLQPGVKRPSIV
jgi:hypothetical protein